MTTAREFQDVESDYDVLEEFFSDAFEHKGKQKYEQGREEGIEQGRTQTIYEVIMGNYRCKYGDDVPNALAEKINDVNSFQALEEIQLEVWLTPSPEAYERGVDAIIRRHAEN